MVMCVTKNPSCDPLEIGDKPAAWGAVFAIALGAFALIASEFLPVSLLTPIAVGLKITEGQAGQAISVSGAFALITSLAISSLAGQLDRKVLLLSLTALMIGSGMVVALAPNYATFIVGRALIGIAIGGFWSMSVATAMRLVPDAQIPRALAIINGGNAVASVVAAPLGSYLGSIIGWRGAFFCVVPLATITLIWQWISLPSMPAARRAKSNLFRLLLRPSVGVGMLAVSLFFMGQFTLFTYLRPFLETVTHVHAGGLSLLLLTIGVTGVAGTALIGPLLASSLYRTLIAIPILMAAIALALLAYGSSVAATAVLLGAWGFTATAAPVAWWTWLARALPDDAEAGGGLMVAVVQLAIAAGATAGGVLFDASGYKATFGVSAGLLLAAAVIATLTAMAVRRSRSSQGVLGAQTS